MDKPIKIAALDDYQQVALQMADWSGVLRLARVTVFKDHIADEELLVERLLPFQVVCIDNVLTTPHIGYVTKETYRVFYGNTAKAIESF